MVFLYNIGIRLYGTGIRIASLFNEKAKLWVNGRKNLWDKLPDLTDKDVIWFHCASLGEFDQGLPLMEKIKAEHPEYFLLVTFFSPSGMQHYHKRDHKADYVCYIPLDTSGNAKRFIEHTHPKKVFFIKYEFWAKHIFAAKEKGAELYNVSGLFRPDHRFFKWYGGYFRKVLAQFNGFFVQNEASKALLNSIDLHNVEVTGDSRFDKVIANRKNVKSNSILEAFCQNEKAFIIGSSWPQDEAIVLPAINKIEGKVIIAPHNVDDKHVEGITSKLNRSFVKYTETNEAEVASADILVLNTIGQLSNAYNYGKLAYVGGGFSGSLHNILEPAVFGMGVIFGPKHTRFPEAQQFINNGFGFSVSTEEELMEKINFINQHQKEINQKAEDFVQANEGASDKIFSTVFKS